MVELREIGKENYKQALELEVEPEQSRHVAPNVVSLAQAWVFREIARPFAVCDGDTVVGFAMLAVDDAKREYGVWRFMIDRRQQRKGYGRAAMERIFEYFRSLGIREITLSYVPGNAAAETLYTRCGFVPTGEVDDGEIVMRRTFDPETAEAGKDCA